VKENWVPFSYAGKLKKKLFVFFPSSENAGHNFPSSLLKKSGRVRQEEEKNFRKKSVFFSRLKWRKECFIHVAWQTGFARYWKPDLGGGGNQWIEQKKSANWTKKNLKLTNLHSW
jgi:hypothetical protein